MHWSKACLRRLEGLFTLLLSCLLAGSLPSLDGSLCLAGLALLAQEVFATLKLQVHLARQLWRREWRVLLLLHLPIHDQMDRFS